MTKTESERWWHAFTNDGACCGITMAILIGGTTEHPEELMHRRDRDGVLSTVFCTWGCQEQSFLRYVRSWNHEPNEDEREAAGLDLGGDMDDDNGEEE